MKTITPNLSQLALRFSVLLLTLLVMTGSASASSIDGPPLSTFRIRTDVARGSSIISGHGTAFGVELSEYGLMRPRYALTACHVIRETDGSICPYIRLELKEGCATCWTRCRVMTYDSKLDVALLECESDLPSISRLARSDVAAGAPIVLVGSPEGVPLHAYSGTVLRRNGMDLSAARVEFFKQGCSGGPVFDARSHELVGLAVAGLGKDPNSEKMDPHTCLFVSLANVRAFVSSATQRYHGRSAAYSPPAAPYIPYVPYAPPPLARSQPRRDYARSVESRYDGDVETLAPLPAAYRSR